MRRGWAIAAVLYLLVACSWAQERQATVRLDGGVTLQGSVVAMDLERLQLRTADGIVEVPAARIQRFAFDDESRPAARTTRQVAPGEPEPAPLGEGEPTGSVDPEPESEVAPARPNAASTGPVGGSARPKPSAGKPARGTSSAALALDPEDLPHDLRHSSRFAERLARLDHRYPWLVPAMPLQWFSISLTAFALLSLIIHLAVKLASGEVPEFVRSLRLALCYLVATVVQFAFVPGNDFAVVVMLLLNPALALFLLCRWFGLGRVASLFAFAIQLGFLTLGVMAILLVDAVLASVAPTAG